MHVPWEMGREQNNIISIKGNLFRKIRVLGEGYQSIVYETRQMNGGFRCAIKVVSFKHHDSHERKDLYKVFLKELGLLTKLQNQSQHIARIYQYDIDQYTMTGKIVMELGTKDFRSILPLRAPAAVKVIKEPDRKYYWRQMVEAIRVIHSNGITHSDVKPENFVFVHNTLKIIDFGMSFIIPAGHSTTLRPFAGTPDYMPPEVCRPSGVMTKFGFKADIWSLGCILYEMSFGVRPFENIQGDINKMRYIGSLVSIVIPNNSDYMLKHILDWCMQTKESRRPTADQILAHPYLKC